MHTAKTFSIGQAQKLPQETIINRIPLDFKILKFETKNEVRHGYSSYKTKRETATTMPTTMFRAMAMEFLSPKSITTHSHALLLFVLYLFIRHYRTTKFDDVDSFETDDSKTFLSKTNQNYARTAVISTSKFCGSASDGNRREIVKSSTLSTTSHIHSEETRHKFDHELSLLEKDSSIRLGSTLSERRRFLVACKGNTTATMERLNHYIKWNEQHVKLRDENQIRIKHTGDRDYDLWVESCLTAMKMSGEVEKIVLPRIIRMLCREEKRNIFKNDESFHKIGNSDYLDRDGYRTFCFRPALMDIKLAKASTYTLAVAIYLDRSCDREEMEKVTVCVDVRAGRGWPNTHVLRLIPFIKHCMKILLPLFPERLHKAVVYPIPPAFLHVWRMISKYMDPLTAERVCVIEGKCKIEAPPPMEKLLVHFGEEELERLEASRLKSFKL